MTPGSAGGELGDHRALRRDKTIPSLVIRRCYPVCPSRNLPSVSAKPREEIEERWLSSIYHGSAWHRTASLPTVIQIWKYRGEDAHQKLSLWKPFFSLDHGCLADKQAAGLGKCHTKGNSLSKLLLFFCFFDCERLETRTLRCMPCVNILPGTVEWSHVMQVKYKLQTVVNNCDFICTLNFLAF